ncbi:hypothetical protein NPIL_219231 [Nephila pilipes]|uniref:Uncharacterized protein n=1 Tax=Nephila pilipes TaxID=299642 RepID=A0A8X6URC2_NEPPI|nr:hypothetical protein NPIL_219231 [Nephila pilipes]
MRSTYQDELLSKIKTKYGRNNCLLNISHKFRRDTVAAFHLFMGHDCLDTHLYRIDILTEAAYLCVTKEMSLSTNTTCIPMKLFSEIRNHRDIGRRDDFWGDNLPLSKEPLAIGNKTKIYIYEDNFIISLHYLVLSNVIDIVKGTILLLYLKIN